jgi:NADH dehydrogenase (ubiquinone) 1 alpha subcomplex subunit 9
MIERMVSNSNVVVNLVGPRKKVKSKEEFTEINVNIPRKIAKACRQNKNILRMIHFSAAGASPNSPSLDL